MNFFGGSTWREVNMSKIKSQGTLSVKIVQNTAFVE